MLPRAGCKANTAAHQFKRVLQVSCFRACMRTVGLFCAVQCCCSCEARLLVLRRPLLCVHGQSFRLCARARRAQANAGHVSSLVIRAIVAPSLCSSSELTNRNLCRLQRTLFSMLASRLVLNLRGALFKRTLATTIALDSAVNRRAGDVTPPTGPTSAANTQGTGTNTLSTTTCKGSPSKAFASSSSSSLSRMASTNHTGLSESRSKRHATRASVDLGNKRTGRNTRQHTLLQAPSKYEWSEEYRDVELQVHTGTASCGAGDLFQFDDLTTLNFSDFQLANTHPHARTSSQSRLSDDDDERQSEDGTIRSSIPYVRSPVSNLSDMQTTSEPSTRHLRFHSLGGSRDVPSRLSRGIVLDLEAGPSAPPVHTRSRRTFSL